MNHKGDSKPNLILVLHLPSSSGEPQLLPVVLPALLLLICITITILTLAKIKLQKQRGKLARQRLLGLQWLFCKGFDCDFQGLESDPWNISISQTRVRSAAPERGWTFKQSP